MTDHRVLSIALTAAVAALTSGCEVGGGPSTGGDDAVQIVGGTPSNVPGVVSIAIDRPDGSGGLCSGTVIADRVILSAAHCVHPDLVGAASFEVRGGPDFFQPKQSLTVAEVAWHPGFDPANLAAGHDLAVLVLAEPTILPSIAVLLDPFEPAWVGQLAHQVGFGIADPTSGSGAGTQRETYTLLSAFTDATLFFADNTRTQCHGDSGGPSLLEIDGVETIVGVSSYGPVAPGLPDCTLGSYDARTDVDADWIFGWLDGSGGGGDDSDDGGSDDNGGSSSSSVQVRGLYAECAPDAGEPPGGACQSADDCAETCCPCKFGGQSGYLYAAACEDGVCSAQACELGAEQYGGFCQ